MAFEITHHCIQCDACKIVCPKRAIQRHSEGLVMTHRCNECQDQTSIHCASICPVENAIVDAQGHSLNPTDSLQPDECILTLIRQRQGLTL